MKISTAQRFIQFISIAFISRSVAISVSTASQSHPHLSVDYKVVVNNISAIRLAMTIIEAEITAGIKLMLHSKESKFL